MAGCVSGVECPVENGDHEIVAILISVLCDIFPALLSGPMQLQRRYIARLAGIGFCRRSGP